MAKTHDPAERKRRIIALAGLGLVMVALVGGSIYFGQQLTAWMKDPALFRDWAQSKGFLGKLAIVGINTAQVLLAFIPGEPVEICAGLAFGPWQGMALVLTGTLLGTCLIFFLTKRFGMRFVEIFVSREQIQNLPLIKQPKRLNQLVFLLFLIPGTPKDLLTYAVGFTPMALWRFLLLSTVARIPSVITSTLGGGALGENNYGTALWIFGGTLLLSAVCVLIYRRTQRVQ